MIVPWPLVRSKASGRRASFSSDVSLRGIVSRRMPPNGMTRSSKNPRSHAATRTLVAHQRILVLLGAADAPLLRGDLGVLAHAHARRAVGHGRDIEPDVVEPEIGDVLDLLLERPGALELADPVGEALAQPELDAAEAVDAADEREIAMRAVDHPGGLEGPDHAGGAGHDGREGGHRCVDAGIHQLLRGRCCSRSGWARRGPRRRSPAAAPSSWPIMWRATGTESPMASTRRARRRSWRTAS